MNVRSLNIARSVAVIGGMVALITGVTFAALQTDTVTLANNTISTASAELLIWNGSEFTNTSQGFAVTNLIPGEGSDAYPFYFKNNSAFDLKLSAHVGGPVDITGITGGASNVKIKFTDKGSGEVTNTTLQALIDNDVNLEGVLGANAQGNAGVPVTEGNYTVEFDIDPAAVQGSGANVGTFDLEFTGTQVVPAT